MFIHRCSSLIKRPSHIAINSNVTGPTFRFNSCLNRIITPISSTHKVSFTTITHRDIVNPTDWSQIISELQKNQVQKNEGIELTKTLILQPKPELIPNQLVAVVTSIDSSINMRSIARFFKFKELRFAKPEVLERISADREKISLLSLGELSPEIKSELLVVIDEPIFKTSSTLAFRGQEAGNTYLFSPNELSLYLKESNLKHESVDLSQVAAPVGKPAKGSPSNVRGEKVGSKMGLECKKNENFSMWYTQVLVKSEMIEYYSVSGCYIYRPWSFSIWRRITSFFDKAITDMGVEPAYFPLFVSQAVLEKEKDHIQGFAPEVAWVTRAGSTKLEVPIAIRPTSETAMYPYFSKWIRSHRDLPMRLNQWNSVVRWEFKDPQPFIRTREFLWQEGHSAFLTKEEADDEVLQVLDLYRQVYEDLLAIPVIKGFKSENEKFAGGLYTTTCEGYIPETGRGIQSATSHSLGQNFSRMFDISVEDPENSDQKLHAWQNSWGLSTRSIGVMVMVHSDDKGLVLPPRVADVQVIFVPCGFKVSSSEAERARIEDAIKVAISSLSSVGVRAKADLRDNYTPGFKFNHWELKGVPLRIEVGPKELDKDCVVSVRRHNGLKLSLPFKDLGVSIPALLETIHTDMFTRAKSVLDQNIVKVSHWDQVIPALDNKSLVLMPWCEQVSCELDIKATTASAKDGEKMVAGAKSLCIPFDQPSDLILEETKCVACQQLAKRYALFGRSY